jgi:hypothetical protein
MSGLFCIINGDPIYNSNEEAVSNIKLHIAKDYPKYNKQTYEYNVYKSDVNNKWYIETKIFKKLNSLNDKFIIEI